MATAACTTPLSRSCSRTIFFDATTNSDYAITTSLSPCIGTSIRLRAS